jgi:hypothetical protein
MVKISDNKAQWALLKHFGVGHSELDAGKEAIGHDSRPASKIHVPLVPDFP